MFRTSRPLRVCEASHPIWKMDFPAVFGHDENFSWRLFFSTARALKSFVEEWERKRGSLPIGKFGARRLFGNEKTKFDFPFRICFFLPDARSIFRTWGFGWENINIKVVFRTCLSNWKLLKFSILGQKYEANFLFSPFAWRDGFANCLLKVELF